MIRINALNDADASLSGGVEGHVTTKEAQEEAAYCLYNKALEFQKQGDNVQAEDVFRQLLQTQFLSKVVPPEEGEESPLSPAQTLKYLAFKNMASIASERKDYHQAMESYLDAVNIDATDVSLWFRMGLVALKLHNYPLARLSFEEGLKCNPKHWPCLDNVITVLYALNDYANCLYYISKALECESYFMKGLVFRDQIYKEHAGLHSFCDEYFINCDQSIYTASYDKEEAQKFIDDALAMREKKREISKLPPLPVLKFQQSLVEFKWKQLGERLISLYDYIKSSNPKISFGCRVDLQMYLENAEKALPEINTDQEKRPLSPTTASSSFDSIASTSPTSVPSSQNNEQLQLCSQEQVLVEEPEPQVLMEIEETPLGCSVVTTPNVEVKSSQQEVIPYLDAASLPIVCSRRRGPKRKRLLMESMECGIKRRSARVRNTGKKHQEHSCVNYQDLLKKFLPSTLNDTKEQDEENGAVNDLEASLYETDRNLLNGSQDDQNKSTKTVITLNLSEVDDVKKFLLDNQKNGGVLDLLYKYLVELSARSELLWPPGLIDVYLAGYNRSREHFTLPSLFTQNTEFEAVKDQGLMTLMYMELKMDKWHAKDPADALSSSSLKGCNSNNLEQDIGKYFWEDMDFLLQMSVLKCVLGDYLETFVMRAFWVKGRFYILEGDIENAVRCFEQLIDVIEETEEETKKPVKHGLINCSSMNVITKDLVKEQLESLQRCQSLEEVHRLYEQGDFQAVVDLLIATFRQAQARRKVSNDGNIPERHAQLKLLHDSLWKLENYQDCLIWGEAGFDEALTQYMIVLSASERTVWAETMSHLLSGLDKCINVDKELLDKMSKTKLIRLANNLINLISLQMLVAETALESEIPTVSPWILLYHVIKHEELKIQNENTQASNSPKRNEIQIADSTPKLNPQEGDFGLGVPSSLMLLLTAHECLGRFSWCSGSDGALLLLSVDIMSTELQRSTPANPNPFREDLESGLEQCFYCLYGHPNKRTKAKHLQEHNAQSIPLTWERSLLLFEYFKPNVLPEFDSYRTNAVSAELENLLRRISSLIPTEEDPLARTDGITAYIEGGTDKLPPFASDKSPPSPIVKDLYYLLGDYYFKNKEFGKAIKYYTLDICVNTHRFDSWAGMALARSSQLEQKLSCCDLKNEGAIYRKSTSALRCFKQALELDSTHTSLWIEYGSIAYMLHSHTSRQLKQQSQLNFGDDVLELLQKKKEEMLSTAENCFLSAKQCEIEGVEVDEVWLHHYMLGKIAEKKSDHPKVYLEHYKQAAKYLHEDEARYPKKIHYHNPPELSIEALEIYHRTHVSILKYLFRHKETLVSQDDLELFQGYLTEAASSPFAKFQEKSERDSRYTSLSSSEAEDTSLALPTSKRRAKKAAAVARDHDYFQGQKQLSNNIKLESSRQRHHRVSIDSSSESQDSAAVKDVLNSIVAVVSESANENEDQGGPTIVLGDHKIHKLINKKDDIISIPNSPYSAITPDSNLVSDTPMQEQMKVSSDESNNLIIDSAKAAKFMGKSNRDKEVLTKTEEQENVTKIQETIEEFALPKSNYDLPSSKPLLQSTTNLIGNFEIESKSVECIALIEIEKINDELKEIVKKQELERRGITSESTEKTPVTVGDIFEQCLTAVKNCLQRFTQHYKSLYRIAHYYFYSTKSKNLPLAREVLLGSSNGHTAIGHQGLFSERKNTNFFNGIWRIPIDEIDRPGSFGAHMYRSIVLLMEVLDQLEDHAMLLHLTVQLNRIPDLGKKYLRDTDRAYLARETFSRCLKVHRNQLNSLLQEEPPPEETRLISCLLDIFRTWHSLQKAAVFPELANELLEEAYSMYKLGEVDPSPPVLEQAIRFCQVQQLKQSNSQITQDLSRNLIISGIFIKPAENVIDALATPYTAITSTTEAPTNEVGQTANEQKLENLATLFVSQNPALSLAYISPLELQPGEAVATSSQTPSAFRSQYHSSNITSYISCPVQMSETVPTIPTIAEPASAMNVISGARYMAPYASINTMRKRWQTHGGRRHRFGVAAPKSYIQMPLIKTDINTKQVFPTITDIEKQHVDKK